MTTTQKNSSLKTLLTAALSFSVILLSIGCAQNGQFPLSSLEDVNLGSGVTPLPPEPGPYTMAPLAWESANYPERKNWSAHLQKIILNDWNTLLAGSNDITAFCPTYHKLENEQRANVWAQIFVAIAKYESAYSPVSRMQETTMGVDPVTNKPVFSEGLLQLSYQDIQWASWCDFDWNKDKSLSPTDPKKTILSPYKNLDCGVGIMARQVKNKGSIVLASGVYWAVIKSGGKYQQLSSIQSMVKSLPLCK